LATLHKFNSTVRYRTLRVCKYLRVKTNPIVQHFPSTNTFAHQYVRHPELPGGNLISVTPNLFPPDEEPYAAFC
jgi:hypothetical protein